MKSASDAPEPDISAICFQPYIAQMRISEIYAKSTVECTNEMLFLFLGVNPRMHIAEINLEVSEMVARYRVNTSMSSLDGNDSREASATVMLMGAAGGK
jgi:hypothetical protein